MDIPCGYVIWGPLLISVSYLGMGFLHTAISFTLLLFLIHLVHNLYFAIHGCLCFLAYILPLFQYVFHLLGYPIYHFYVWIYNNVLMQHVHGLGAAHNSRFRSHKLDIPACYISPYATFPLNTRTPLSVFRYHTLFLYLLPLFCMVYEGFSPFPNRYAVCLSTSPKVLNNSPNPSFSHISHSPISSQYDISHSPVFPYDASSALHYIVFCYMLGIYTQYYFPSRALRYIMFRMLKGVCYFFKKPCLYTIRFYYHL